MVNLPRVAEARRKEDSEGWEVKLAPPVNRILPVSRANVERLFQACDIRG